MDQQIPQADAGWQNCCSNSLSERKSQEQETECLTEWVLRATANHVQLSAMMFDALKKSSSFTRQILRRIKSSPKTAHNLWKQRNPFFNIHVCILHKIIHNLTEPKNRPNLSSNSLLDESELSELSLTTCHLIKHICCRFQQMLSTWNRRGLNTSVNYS